MNTTTDYQTLYIQIGRLLQSAPEITDPAHLGQMSTLQWLGKAAALVGAVNATAYDLVQFTNATDKLRTAGWKYAVQEIFAIIYRAQAHCEIKLPVGQAGAFIPVGSSFDAFTALSKILQQATSDVMFIDPYMDECVLTEFGITVNEGVPIRILADEASYRTTLRTAATRWIQQYGEKRPLEVRLAQAKSLHDRAIFIDRTTAWTLTQSLKDFAKRSPAEIVNASDTAFMKIEAYQKIWNESTPI